MTIEAQDLAQAVESRLYRLGAALADAQDELRFLTRALIPPGEKGPSLPDPDVLVDLSPIEEEARGAAPPDRSN
jgi:hypothetical protein